MSKEESPRKRKADDDQPTGNKGPSPPPKMGAHAWLRFSFKRKRSLWAEGCLVTSQEEPLFNWSGVPFQCFRCRDARFAPAVPCETETYQQGVTDRCTACGADRFPAAVDYCEQCMRWQYGRTNRMCNWRDCSRYTEARTRFGGAFEIFGYYSNQHRCINYSYDEDNLPRFDGAQLRWDEVFEPDIVLEKVSRRLFGANYNLPPSDVPLAVVAPRDEKKNAKQLEDLSFDDDDDVGEGDNVVG